MSKFALFTAVGLFFIGSPARVHADTLLQHQRSGFCAHPQSGVAGSAGSSKLRLHPDCRPGPKTTFVLSAANILFHPASDTCLRPQGSLPTPTTALLLQGQCKPNPALSFHISGSYLVHSQSGLCVKPDGKNNLILANRCDSEASFIKLKDLQQPPQEGRPQEATQPVMSKDFLDNMADYLYLISSKGLYAHCEMARCQMLESRDLATPFRLSPSTHVKTFREASSLILTTLEGLTLQKGKNFGLLHLDFKSEEAYTLAPISTPDGLLLLQNIRHLRNGRLAEHPEARVGPEVSLVQTTTALKAQPIVNKRCEETLQRVKTFKGLLLDEVIGLGSKNIYFGQKPPVPSQEFIDRYYERMAAVDEVFSSHGIPYFLTMGTLLGAVRNGGMIPNDDDIDIGVFAEYTDKIMSPEIKEAFAERGFVLLDRPFSMKLYTDASKLKSGLDIFPFKRRREFGKVAYYHANEVSFHAWGGTEFYWDHEMTAFQRVPYGHLNLLNFTTATSYAFLDRKYGTNWCKEVYKIWDHVEGKAADSKKKLMTIEHDYYYLRASTQERD